MFGCIMPLEPLRQSAGLFRGESFVKRSRRMGVQIIRNENNLILCRVKRVRSILQDMGKSQRCAHLRDNGFPLSCQWFTNHKHIGNTIADIIRIHLFRPARFTGYTSFLNQLFVRLINTDSWGERIVRPLIYFQHILHFRYKFRIRLGDAPFLDLPRLDFIFFITS